MATIKLGELLVKANLLQESQLKQALAEQQKWGGRLGDILVRMSLVTEEMIVRALSKQMAVQAVNLEAIQGIPPHVKAKLPLQLARDLAAVPVQLRDEGKTLVVAMAEPQNIQQVDMIRARTNCRIITQLAGRTAISRAVARFYENAEDLSDVESSFKVVDAQGRTVVKSVQELEARGAAATSGPVPRADLPSAQVPGAQAPAGRRASASGEVAAGRSAVEILRAVEEVQRKEVAALKAMVELLIEKGVFSREEYLARVKR